MVPKRDNPKNGSVQGNNIILKLSKIFYGVPSSESYLGKNRHIRVGGIFENT
jgi:hypothetical protein